MKIIAIEKIMVLAEFLIKEKLVGSAFNRSEYLMINRFNSFLKMKESINATKSEPMTNTL